jgi:hypothetical protein
MFFSDTHSACISDIIRGKSRSRRSSSSLRPHRGPAATAAGLGRVWERQLIRHQRSDLLLWVQPYEYCLFWLRVAMLGAAHTSLVLTSALRGASRAVSRDSTGAVVVSLARKVCVLCAV